MTLELNIFHLSSKHDNLIGTSVGEHCAWKLEGELRESLEEFDEELSTPSITPAAPPVPPAPPDNT